MKVNTLMTSFVGKITKIGKIESTEGGHKVVSVTVPVNIGIRDSLETRPCEVSFWDKDAETLAKYPIGTPIYIREGALYLKPFVKKDGEADVSIVVSNYQWSVCEDQVSTQNTKASTPPSAALMPKELREIMSAGKYKGKGMTYFDILTQDRKYINDLILNESTPENWKLKLVEVSKAYDDYLKKHRG